MIAVKEAIEMLNKLPLESTWDDIMHEIYVRQKIEKSLDSADEGNTVSFDEAKKRLIER